MLNRITYTVVESYALMFLVLACIGFLLFYQHTRDDQLGVSGTVTGYIAQDKNLQNKQLDDLAFTLFAEDRTNKLGMKYVLSVITNRARSTEISAMHAVALKRKQFSCWVNGKRVKQTYNALDKLRYTQALELVKRASKGGFKPLTRATHYYNPGKVTPYWRYQFKAVAFINSHVFLVLRTS